MLITPTATSYKQPQAPRIERFVPNLLAYFWRRGSGLLGPARVFEVVDSYYVHVHIDRKTFLFNGIQQVLFEAAYQPYNDNETDSWKISDLSSTIFFRPAGPYCPTALSTTSAVTRRELQSLHADISCV